jgi:histidinol-phosphate phosphatase family protein
MIPVPKAKSFQKTLFLDRDGTLIVEREYLCNPAEVELERGAAEALKRFSDAGYWIVVASNQSGIGRGYFTESQLTAVNTQVQALLALHGARIDAWYHCPHAPDEKCKCRKPLPGMLDAAAVDQPIDWKKSIMVGDKPQDVEAALARGVSGWMVLTGHGSKHRGWAEKYSVPTIEFLGELASKVLD